MKERIIVLPEAAQAKRRRQTMKSILYASLSILLMPSAFAASLPGDSTEGKRLLDANCMECHQTDIYTRKDRKVQSLDGLKEQVTGCTHMAEKEFSASEMQDLLKYLNDQFYQFD
jgi:cytochrome c553